MKKLLSMMLIIGLLLCTVPFMASAEAAVPFSIPTISSRRCTTCEVSMDHISTELVIREKEIVSTECPNSPFAQEGHTHTHFYFYNCSVYMCPVCNHFGQMLTFDHMECEVSRGMK